MGAMKAIYTDTQELQEAAESKDEEAFMMYVQDMGWVSPTEQEIRQRRAVEAFSTLAEPARSACLDVLRKVGIDMSTVDFPIGTMSNNQTHAHPKEGLILV
jgi:hypothetical protein